MDSRGEGLPLPPEGNTKGEVEKNTELQKTVFLETGPISVTTSREALVQDFLEEAQRQGVNGEAAMLAVEDTSFSLLSPVELFRQPKDKGGVLQTFGRSIEAITSKLGKHNTLGFVEHGLNGNIVRMNLDVEAIASKVGKGGSRKFRIPRDMPTEYQESAFSQLLDAIWRHERQHLIQAVTPKTTGKKLEKGLIVSSMLGGPLAQVGSLGLTLACREYVSDPELWKTLHNASIGLAITSAIVTPAGILAHERFSSYERDANKHVATRASGISPFVITPEQ